MFLSLLCLPAIAGTTLLGPDADSASFRVVTTTTGDTVASVKAEVSSEGGSGTVTLSVTDTMLHGVASITSLPAAGSTATLTLYDTGSAPIQALTGTFAEDGSLDLAPEGALDVEVLAAESFATGSGWDVDFDLHGADTPDVAYATLTITETVTVISCEKGGECLPVTSTRETDAEVGFDAVSWVWDKFLPFVPEGLVTVKATTYNSRGKKIGSTKASVGMPWSDDGASIPTVPTDEDPLTTLALHRRSWDEPMEVPLVSIVSDGWNDRDPSPTSAELELSTGATLEFAATSFQRTAYETVAITHPFENIVISHRISGGTGVSYTLDGAEVLSLADLADGVCIDGVCVVVTDLGDELGVSVTAYSDAITTIPEDVELLLTVVDGDGEPLDSASIYPHFQDDVIAMFTANAELDGDPVGTDVTGKLKLLGAATRGKAKTLAKGKVYATIGRDPDGELSLAGVDKDSAVGSSVLALGAALTLGDLNGDGYTDGPPVLAMESSSGPTVGTKHGDILIDGVPIDYD